MPNLSALIGTTSVVILAISENNTMDGRSVTTLTVYDAAGTLDFQPRTPVSVSDTLNNYFFTGFVSNDVKTPEPNGVALTHAVACVDDTDTAGNHYYAGPEWTNRYAGDIVTDLVANVLSADGILASYALDEDKSVSDWQQGTQSNTAAVATATGGALQLALAGSAVTKQEQNGTDWGTGTRTNLHVSGATLTLKNYSAIMLQGQCIGYEGVGGAYANLGLWGGSYSIATGDTLKYTIWISSTSPSITASIDGVCNADGTTIGNYAPSFSHQVRDQNGLWASPQQDLTGYANDQWYSRTIDIGTLMHGQTLNSIYMQLSAANNSKGQYNVYVHDISIVNGGTTKLTVAPANTSGLRFILASALSQRGFLNLQATQLTAYEPTGTRLSNATDLTPVGCFGPSLLTYQATLPTSQLSGASSNVAIYTSTDNATWQLATSAAAIPSLIVGAASSGVSLYLKEVLTIVGPDPTISPVLTNVTATVQPTYVNVNTDFIKTVSTQAGWNGGTLTGLTAQSDNSLTLQKATTNNWDGTTGTPNQTLFTNSGGSQSTVNRDLALTATNGNDARARFDFAGTFNQLDMSINVQVPPAGANIGLEFGTTNWVNGLNSYAYVAYITTTQIKFSKGTNGTAGAETNLANASFGTALTPGDWHTLRVQWGQSANAIVVYLDGAQFLSTTDATYPSSGALSYVGARFYNNSGSATTDYFSNFAIVQTLASNLYTSQNLTGFGNVGSVQDSRLFWQSNEPTGSGIVAQVSVNGGAYANATNGATIPGLTQGMSVTGQHLNVKFTFNTTDPTLQPVLYGYTAWVSSAYNASGSRVSVPLSLAPVGNAGNTGATWTGVQPAKTNIFVDTSTDSINWNNAGVGVTGQATVAGIFSQTDPIIDQFSSNTSANYTSTYRTGGGVAAWVWNTALNRLEVSGGTNAHLIYNSPVTGVDVDISAVIDQSDNGGFVWRWVDQSNFYYLALHDASAGTIPNTAQLFVVSAGVTSQIGSNAAMSFTRGTPHAFRVTMIGTSILILMDGATLFNTGDATINQAGFAGFRTDSTGGSSARFYLFRLQYYGQDVSNATIFSRVRFTSTDPTQTPQLNQLSMSVHDPAIQNGALVPQTNYSVLNNNRITIAQICDDLARQSTNFWTKIISSQLFFQQHQATPAPWPLTPTGATNVDIVDSPAPTLDNMNSTYRNSQWGTGGVDIVAIPPKSFTGDGTRTTFDVGFPIDSISSISLGSTPQTFGINGSSTGMNWYYTQGQSAIVQDTSGTPLVSSQTLTVAFNAQVGITVNVQNPAEVARIAALAQSTGNTPNTGIIDEGEDMAGLNKQAMIAKCSGLVNQFGQQNKTLTFTTNRPGLAVGQLQCAFVGPLGVFAGAFLLIAVKISWRTVGAGGSSVVQSPQFEVVGVSGPQALSWLRWVSRLGVN